MRATVAAIAIAAVSCGASTPAAPSEWPPVGQSRPVPNPGPYTPQHNNIPATFKGDPAGPLVWLCATLPREYTNGLGEHMLVEDHYLQYEPCPTELER